MNGLRFGLHRFCVMLTRVAETLAAILLAAIVVINFLGVFFRYGLRDPIGWTEESMRYAIVWATFLGGSAALYRGEHMVLDLFEGVPIPWLRRAMHVAVLLCIAIFAATIVVYGWPLAVRNWRQASPTMNIPMFWPYVAVTVGMALVFIKSIALLLLPPGFAAKSFNDAPIAADLDPSDT